MTRRDVIRAVVSGERPPYVPWSYGFTVEAREKLERLNQQVAADAQKAATFDGDYARVMAETPAKTDAAAKGAETAKSAAPSAK